MTQLRRQRNGGVRKICGCPRRSWPKCRHSWHLNFKLRGGPSYRFCLDAEVGDPIETKEQAKTHADRIRSEIRAGTFVRAEDRRKAAEAERQRAALATVANSTSAVTLKDFGTVYVERVSQRRIKNKNWKADKFMFARMAAFPLPSGSLLGDKALRAITEDDLEAFMASIRAAGRAASTRNHYVQLLKASLKWAARKLYLDQSPITEDAEIKRSKLAQRNRRLTPDRLDDQGRLAVPGEERRLLSVAGPRL